MELIEIDEVTALTGSSEHLAGSSVEIPGPGTDCADWVIPISGWVVGRSEPVISVEVVEQGIRVRSAAVQSARDDVAAAYPGLPGSERPGFRLHIGGVWMPENFVLRLEAGFANGHRVPFALIRGRRGAIPAAPTGEGIQPISVTALPRSGATLVMQMLAAHPEVVVAGAHPYSARPGAYWAHMLRVMSAPADWRESAHPDTFEGDLNWVGHHPLIGPPLIDAPEVGRWFGGEYVSQLAAFAARSASDLYARVASSKAISEPRYYAEKAEPGAIARLIAGLHPDGREIIVVRDFRDMACSMLAFARKTRTAQPPTDEQFALSLVPALARLLAYTNERGESALVVRYEDLVAEPSRTLGQILDHLGLKCGRRELRAIAAQATAPAPQLVAHATSPDAESSVGRYLENMDSELLLAAEESFGPALDAFNYARAATAVAV